MAKASRAWEVGHEDAVAHFESSIPEEGKGRVDSTMWTSMNQENERTIFCSVLKLGYDIVLMSLKIVAMDWLMILLEEEIFLIGRGDQMK